MSSWRRVGLALSALAVVTVVGTLGYVVLGFSPLDALYQTVTTVFTVGFREVEPLDTAGKVFTIVLIVVGVGTALYTLGALLELLIEGQLREEPRAIREARRDRLELLEVAQARVGVVVAPLHER